MNENPTSRQLCELCGAPMPKGEESFRFHGYSGPCPAVSPEGATIEQQFTDFVGRVLTFGRIKPITEDASHFTRELLGKWNYRESAWQEFEMELRNHCDPSSHLFQHFLAIRGKVE